MKKLWQTAVDLDCAVEKYTVGDDPRLDSRLLPYEVYGSLAHAAGLVQIGILSKGEYAKIQKVLAGMLKKASAFKVTQEQEDVHTAVEQELTRVLGETGAKVHAGRSRNDQVQVDLRLFLKDRLLSLIESALHAAVEWEKFGRKYEKTLIPGYTHLQKAMPTTVGHWAASHTEALLENVRALQFAYSEADASPLGSAAGYGVTLPLPRAYVAKLLGFSRVQRNTLRVQSSRPRLEAAALSSLALLARDLGGLSWDLSLYLSAEFGFFSLSGSFTTGSSIMPQKKNPDVVELTRGRAALFPGWLAQVLAIGQLPSGYHRDYQLTKGILFQALDTAEAMLDMTARLPAALQVNEARCKAAITRDLLATHEALSLVKKGTPFRDAYRQIADKARSNGAATEAAVVVTLPDYAGAPGQADWGAIASDRRTWERWAASKAQALHSAWDKLA